MKATLSGNGERVTLTENSRDLGHGKQIEVIYSDETKGWAHEEDLIAREFVAEDFEEVKVENVTIGNSYYFGTDLLRGKLKKAKAVSERLSKSGKKIVMFHCPFYKKEDGKAQHQELMWTSTVFELRINGLTYDVHFNDENDSNNKGFKYSLEDAKGYIDSYNGTNESYFEDYKGGTVSIVCNETDETVFETEVLQEKKFNYFYNSVAIPRSQFISSVPSSWENEINEYGEYSYGYYRAIEI